MRLQEDSESVNQSVAKYGEFKPKATITLCGSNKFRDEFFKMGEYFEANGFTVLMPAYFRYKGQRGYIDDDDYKKFILEANHRKRIEFSDIVFILDVEGYIGKSTHSEIEFANKLGKKIIYYSEWSSRDYFGQESLIEGRV